MRGATGAFVPESVRGDRYVERMGTNYYLSAPDLPERLHMGKSSAGWVFHWRGHLDLDIASRGSWEDRFFGMGAVIHDEYGTEVSPSDFIDCAYIENRRKRFKGGTVMSRQGAPTKITDLMVTCADDPSHRCDTFCQRMKDREWIDPFGEHFASYEFS